MNYFNLMVLRREDAKHENKSVDPLNNSPIRGELGSKQWSIELLAQQ